MQIRIDFCDPGQRPGGAAAAGNSALRCAFESPRELLVADTLEQVKPVLDAVERFAQQGLWCVGYLRYEAASAFDVALQSHAGDGPLAWFGVFERSLPWPDKATEPGDAACPAAAKSPEASSNANIEWDSALSHPEFEAQMALIHAAIAAGELYQVCYTAPLQGNFTGSAPALFERLQRAQPGGYCAYIDTDFEQLLSVSPELFFDWKDGHILTRPMKGTAPRGGSAQEDAALAALLRQSPKERAENVMIVDLLRNDLSRIAQPHSVKVPELFRVQTLPTVLQMVSDVTATTNPDTTLAEVFTALFPCGSITGAPKVRAMQMIKALEPAPRGIYCGAIGVVRPGGHATFNVAIRTVTLRDNYATCGIGSGITFDATANAEWQEWQHKRGFLERASEDFKLLETLRLQDGGFHLLEAHLQRLAAAATHFAYPFNQQDIRRALQTLATRHDQGLWRVRLQLDSSGTPHAQAYRQDSTAEPVRIALGAIPFEASGSEFTRFKTTRRAHYEAFAPLDPAVFDTLLYNPRGELTECTRGNIAVLLDGQWLTPTLHCGLLAGIGRAHYLAQGRLKEAVITLADLPRAEDFAFINSLRGWVAARLCHN